MHAASSNLHDTLSVVGVDQPRQPVLRIEAHKKESLFPHSQLRLEEKSWRRYVQRRRICWL